MLSFIATSSGTVAFFTSKDNSYDAAYFSVQNALNVKTHRDFRSFSRCSSWLLDASPDEEFEGYCSLPSSPTSVLMDGDCHSVDMGPEESIKQAEENYNLLQLDNKELAASAPQPHAPWDGRKCLLTGRRYRRKGRAGKQAAYQAACQLQAWRRGALLTYAAALKSEPTPTSPPAAPAPSAATEIVLEPHINFVCCCMEAAAKLGKRATYAQVVACSSE